MASSISKRNSKNQYTIFETAPKATLLMLLTGLFILFVGAFFIQKLDSPVAFSKLFAPFALYLGAAVGGAFCASRMDGKLSLSSALIASSILCIILILAKAFVAEPNDPRGALISFIAHLLIPLTALLGAWIGNRLRIKKEIKNRKNHYRSKK